MSGKCEYDSKPRKNPGIKGRNPHLKAMRKREAEERDAAHKAAGSPRSKKKRLAAQKEAASK